MSDARHPSLARRIPWTIVGIICLGLLSLAWLILTPPGVLGKADAIGYAVCHRIDLRSFHIGTRQFPVCVRCTGQFLGALLAIVYQAAVGKRCMGKPGWAVSTILAGLFLAYLVDGLNSYLHLEPMRIALPALPRLYEPNHILRLLTGTGMGLAIGATLYPAFNSAVWVKPDLRPSLRSLGSVGLLILLGLGLDAIVLLQDPGVLYALAILSALATLTTLGMVYTIVVLMLVRRENHVERLAQLAWPFIAGLGIALAQIAIIDLLRYLLTGTWDGFHLG